MAHTCSLDHGNRLKKKVAFYRPCAGVRKVFSWSDERKKRCQFCLLLPMSAVCHVSPARGSTAAAATRAARGLCRDGPVPFRPARVGKRGSHVFLLWPFLLLLTFAFSLPRSMPVSLSELVSSHNPNAVCAVRLCE